VKLVHLIGFIIKRFVRMHGHMNVKNYKNTRLNFLMTNAAIWFQHFC